MEDMKILQVVGFKNSGKTTLLGRFVEIATNAKKKVSTIKHHGHEGALEMPDVETDSMRFFSKGATSSLAFGNGVVQLHLQNQYEDLQKLIIFSLLAEPDLILIEGFKGSDFPKVVLVRNAEDWSELQKLSKIRLVIVPKDMTLADIDFLELNDQKAIDDFFEQWMEGETG